MSVVVALNQEEIFGPSDLPENFSGGSLRPNRQLSGSSGGQRSLQSSVVFRDSMHGQYVRGVRQGGSYQINYEIDSVRSGSDLAQTVNNSMDYGIKREDRVTSFDSQGGFPHNENLMHDVTR